MGKRGRGQPQSGGAGSGNRPGRSGDSVGPIGLTAVEGTPNAFELVHPRASRKWSRTSRRAWSSGRLATPRRRRRPAYTLQACPANLWVHVALGRIALDEFKDSTLARGHFGYAVELRKVLPAGFSGRLPRDRPANAPFYDAVEGLVRCFRSQAMPREAESLTAFAGRLQES